MSLRQPFQFAIIAFLSFAGLGLSPACAFADVLFESAPAADVPHGEMAVGSRLVRLVASVKASRLAPAGDQDPGRIARAEALEPNLSIEFFPGARAEFIRRRVQARRGGGYVWTGDAEGGRGSATLLVRGDRITGYAELDARTYRIEPVSGSLHRISRIDSAREKQDIVREAPSGPAPRTEAPLAEPPAEPTVIRVLVAYTPAAAAESGDIESEIDLAVQLANEAYEASGVSITLELAGAMLVDYDERGDIDRNLTDLTSGAAFAQARKKRNALSADLVSLMRKEHPLYCGNGWYVRHPAATTSEFGFSVVPRTCVGVHSFAHELGHNMGLQHDRYSTSEKKGFNYGYVNVGARIRDIMAYDNRCYDHRPRLSCARVKMFSTPRLDYNGSRIGIPKGDPKAADNALMLNHNRAAVGAYR